MNVLVLQSFMVLILTVTCREVSGNLPTDGVLARMDTVNTTAAKKKTPYTVFEKSILDSGLKDIQMLDSTIAVALQYATTTNFTGEVLYTDLHHAFLQPEAASKLVNAQKELKAKDNSLSLLIYDALRPNSVQYKMWEVVANTPKQHYVAPPGKGSLHNYGCAVDLTIIRNGIPVDMGTPYDFLGKKAQPRYHDFFLKNGALTRQQIANRVLLRTVMKTAGFIPINSEWWHFNAFTKVYTRNHYSIIE